MKFEIRWLEYHLCDDEISEKEWMDSLPPRTENHGHVYGDEVCEFECVDEFEADSIEQAKEKIKEYECGREGVFCVFSEGKRLFTEEDIHEEWRCQHCAYLYGSEDKQMCDLYDKPCDSVIDCNAWESKGVNHE